MGCTFFRNFASSLVAAYTVSDVWPLVATVEDTDILQNEAFGFMDSFAWGAMTGPQRRVGVASLTHTGNHYDGGFSSEGIFTIYVVTYFVRPGGQPGDPDALWEGTFRDGTWSDFASLIAPAALFLGVWPNGGGTQARFNTFVEDSVITDVVALAAGSRVDGMYANAWPTAGGVCQFTRTRFERSGIFDPAAIGTGGIEVQGPTAGSTSDVAIIEFEATDFEGNAAGSGAAFFVALGQSDIRVRQCMFRYVHLHHCLLECKSSKADIGLDRQEQRCVFGWRSHRFSSHTFVGAAD